MAARLGAVGFQSTNCFLDVVHENDNGRALLDRFVHLLRILPVETFLPLETGLLLLCYRRQLFERLCDTRTENFLSDLSFSLFSHVRTGSSTFYPCKAATSKVKHSSPQNGRPSWCFSSSYAPKPLETVAFSQITSEHSIQTVYTVGASFSGKLPPKQPHSKVAVTLPTRLD